MRGGRLCQGEDLHRQRRRHVRMQTRRGESQSDFGKTRTGFAGRFIPVLVRTAAEMAAVAKANPFPKTDPARTVAIFLDDVPAKDTAAVARGQTIEEIRLGKREIYVHYGAGMGNTKLKLPAAEKGTARNINTVQKLAALAVALGETSV
jgi:uncharacterized protein (DUF1697 family)